MFIFSSSGAYYGIFDPSQILQKLLTGEIDASVEVGKIVDKGYKRVILKQLLPKFCIK